jgi:hypothetical protein
MTFFSRASMIVWLSAASGASALFAQEAQLPPIPAASRSTPAASRPTPAGGQPTPAGGQPTPAGSRPAGEKVVTPATPEPDGKPPKAAGVQEKQNPAPPADAPADSKPVLSAPAPTPLVAPPVRYFALVFSSESKPKRAKYSHTWVTLVKATPKPGFSDPYDPAADQAKYYDLTAHTISWLPASLNVRVLKLRADVGRNLNLEQTIHYAQCNGECIALWGPFELNPTIAEDVFKKAEKQIARLNSGCILYKAIDPDQGPQAGRVVNCIHAFSDLDGLARRLRYNEMQHYGWDGGLVIVNSLARANRIDPSVRHEWIEAALGLERYCITHLNAPVCRPVVQTAAAR